MKGPVGQLEVSFSRLVVLKSITRSKGPAADANDEAGVTDPIVRKDVKIYMGSSVVNIPCEEWHSAFGQRSDLKSHMRDMHVSTERPDLIFQNFLMKINE